MKVVESAAMSFSPYTSARGPAQERKILAEGELVPGVDFWYALFRFGGNGPFTSPRHHHTFQQVRYVVEGTYNIGPKTTLEEGWVGYFPAGAYYGPQHDEGGTVLYLQFGEGFVTSERQQWALDELAKTGTLNKGVYTVVDQETGKKKNVDAVTAVYELVHKRPLEFPEPRYPSAIRINPAAFDWVQDTASLCRKPLGRFTEREVEVSMLRWETSGPREFSSAHTQLVFSVADGLRVEGHARPAQTAVWSPHGETLELDGEPGAETLLISIPAAAAVS